MPVPVPTAAPPPPPRASATPVATAAAPEDSSSSSPDASATATALPAAAAPPPPNASATPVPVPTAAVSAQLRRLPRKPRAASRSTCRNRFMLTLLSERRNLHALDTTTGGDHAHAAETAFRPLFCAGVISHTWLSTYALEEADQSVEGLN